MTVDTNTMVSITEVNQNFSKVARLVDEIGGVFLYCFLQNYDIIDITGEKVLMIY